MRFLFWATVVALILVAILVALSIWFDINPDAWPFRTWRRWRHGIRNR